MADIAVRVDNVGKRYQIGARRNGGLTTLREAIASGASAPLKKLAAVAQELYQHGSLALHHRTQQDHIWALRNVSFEIPRGQILGIIGPNGAGKSTLLKILSRITDPTEGRVEIHGRVGSLLEVGTGFHPELTGRENTYLSGALLGMRKAEIDRKLDEILAFAEVEKFADTPVKHYSSGMYVRLAFAVAAHLEPEILIVDEVLAVGDVAFQRKCLDKMEDVRRHGRTILFVSHNLEAVTRLCHRAILVSNGAIQQDGLARNVGSSYLLSLVNKTADRLWPDPTTAPRDDIARLKRVRIRTEKGDTAEAVDIRRPVGLEMTYDVLRPGHALVPYFELTNESGLPVFATQDLGLDWHRKKKPTGRFVSTAWIPGDFLAEGTLLVDARLFCCPPFELHFAAPRAAGFQVVDSLDGGGARGDLGQMAGLVRPLLTWTNTVES